MKRILSLCFLALAALSASAVEIPSLNGEDFVFDQAGVLSGAEKSHLNNLLRTQKNATTNHVAVLIVRSLDGTTIEDLAVKTFEKWQLGEKKADNGVLLVLATTDRKTRIEPGYGLEGVLPDGLCGEIARAGRPHFKANEFAKGIEVIVANIAKATKGEYQAAAKASTQSETSGAVGTFLVIVIGAVLFVALILAAGANDIIPGLGGFVMGAACGGIGYLMLSLGWAIGCGIIGFLIGLIAKPIIEGVLSGDGSSSSSWSSSSSGGGGGGWGGGGASGGGGATDSWDD
jgi:uncharacterized protein